MPGYSSNHLVHKMVQLQVAYVRSLAALAGRSSAVPLRATGLPGDAPDQGASGEQYLAPDPAVVRAGFSQPTEQGLSALLWTVAAHNFSSSPR